MMNLPRMPVDPPRAEMRWRHRFTVLTGLSTILLMAWGAFVTSINAGLAVPDWPSSFNSYDPFNPWPVSARRIPWSDVRFPAFGKAQYFLPLLRTEKFALFIQ